MAEQIENPPNILDGFYPSLIDVFQVESFIDVRELNRGIKRKCRASGAKGYSSSEEETENIFKEVQEKTGVQVQWETEKSTKNSKRDSIIRLYGNPFKVETAKEMVLEKLEIQNDEVVLKMDITHEEHSSLIGSRGGVIKKVAGATSCRIHFPDKNIISGRRKSNQVSITGKPFNVEKARKMLRALIPFQVVLFVDESVHHLFDTTDPFWKEFDLNLGLAVHFIKSQNFISCVMRCSQERFYALNPQILQLIEILSCKKEPEIHPVKVVLDINREHQSYVKGPRSKNIKAIFERTGAQVTLPNRNFDSIGVSTVEISGNLESVYMAWQEVMSSLPVTVGIDVKESKGRKNGFADVLTDCHINLCCGSNSNVESITVKGPERLTRQILQYRQRVLNFPRIVFPPDFKDFNENLSFESHLPEAWYDNEYSSESSTSSDDQDFLPDFPVSKRKNQFGIFAKMHRVNQGSSRRTSKIVPTPDLSNTSSDDQERSPDSPISEGESDWEIKDKQIRVNQAMHHELLSSEDPTSLWAHSYYESMIDQIVSDESNEHSPVSSESDDSSSSDEMWQRIVLVDPIHEKKWYNRDGNMLSQSNGFDIMWGTSEQREASELRGSSEQREASKPRDASELRETAEPIETSELRDTSESKDASEPREISAPRNFQAGGRLSQILLKEGLDGCLDTILKYKIDYKRFVYLTNNDLIKLGFCYHIRMRLISLIRALQDAEAANKPFDAAPGAGRNRSKERE